MKKILMGTTALVAATAVTSGAAQAGETSMDISGYNYASYGLFDRDGASGVSGNDIYTNGEIHFRGSTTLDSGLSISYQVQMETEVGTGGIDENSLTFSDSWGSVVVGGDDLPNWTTHVTGAKYTGWHGINTNTITGYVGFSGSYGMTSEFHSAFMNTYGTFGHNDSDMIAYYSPRVSGFQIGVGYAPDDKQNDGGVNTGTDTISVGLNFSHDVQGVGLNASAGMIRRGDDDGDDDEELYNFGLDASMGGFTVGVSYAFTDSTSALNTIGSTTVGSVKAGGGNAITVTSATATKIKESDTFTAGLQYATGPYTLGLAYVHGEATGSTAVAGDDEGDRMALSVAYSLGGGATWDAHFIWSDMQGEAAGAADDVEAYGIISGIGVSF